MLIITHFTPGLKNTRIRFLIAAVINKRRNYNLKIIIVKMQIANLY